MAVLLAAVAEPVAASGDKRQASGVAALLEAVQRSPRQWPGSASGGSRHASGLAVLVAAVATPVAWQC
jgi:hypothetical protein